MLCQTRNEFAWNPTNGLIESIVLVVPTRRVPPSTTCWLLLFCCFSPPLLHPTAASVRLPAGVRVLPEPAGRRASAAERSVRSAS